MAEDLDQRRLFKALGSSPYMLSILRYVDSSPASFSDVENYLGTIRRLYGSKHGLPRSKIVASNLNSLARFGLVVKERFGKVWKTTAKGKAFVDFHNTLVKKPHSIYFWLNGATNPSPKLIDDAGKFLKANHDFYSLEAPNITKVLVRFNSGYTETISLEPRHVVCGLIYSADYARLAVAQKKLVDLGDISKRESETPAFLYAHIISRMKHSVADLDHSLKGKFVKWSDEVGIADPMNRSINFYRWQTRRFIRSFQKSNTIFSTIALLRCIESSYLAEDDEKAKQFMSGPVREIETKIVKVEFSENNERETMLNDYNIIKNGIFGKMSQKRP